MDLYERNKEGSMPSPVYHDLREQLDQYSVGFPATESGIELRILEKLFSEEEASMFLNLGMMLETPQAVAARLGMDPDEVAVLLDHMAEKGLIFRLKKGDAAKYAAAPFVVGSFEFQVKDLDRELAELTEQYFHEAFGKRISEYDAPMRTIPVNKAVDYAYPTAPYEDVRKLFDDKDRIAVAECICKKQQGLLDKGCDKPREVCFAFGSHGSYYVDKGMGRWVTREEALEIIDKCDEAGLVPQPFNAQDAGGLCNCCGDCCGILRSIKLHPRPVDKVICNYFAEVDSDLCTACETCMDRCQMEAISIGSENTAEIDLNRCIGCGLCVTTCPTDALSLKRKSDADIRIPPEKSQQTIMDYFQKRGTSMLPLKVVKASQEK
jgi:Na+-translocating ferredoxin:NAD+ oxidoreductase subunit B